MVKNTKVCEKCGETLLTQGFAMHFLYCKGELMKDKFIKPPQKVYTSAALQTDLMDALRREFPGWSVAGILRNAVIERQYKKQLSTDTRDEV